MIDHTTSRTMMVDTQIRPSDVTKYPIISAMLTVPRESFVPSAMRDAAYVGENVDLGEGRVILEPRTLAKMLDALDIRGDELVLDIGAGFGYSSAVVAHMAEAVVALEEREDLIDDGQTQLSACGADNVIMHHGPLAEGAAAHGPFDVILIQGAVEEVPAAILDQLKDGGRMACLFSDGAFGAVRVGYKIDGEMNWRFVFNAGAPVLPGFNKLSTFVL